MHHIHYFVQPQRREAIREALSLSLQVAFTLRGYVTQSGHARFDLLSQSTAWKAFAPGGLPYKTDRDARRVSLLGVNCRCLCPRGGGGGRGALLHRSRPHSLTFGYY